MTHDADPALVIAAVQTELRPLTDLVARLLKIVEAQQRDLQVLQLEVWSLRAAPPPQD